MISKSLQILPCTCIVPRRSDGTETSIRTRLYHMRIVMDLLSIQWTNSRCIARQTKERLAAICAQDLGKCPPQPGQTQRLFADNDVEIMTLFVMVMVAVGVRCWGTIIPSLEKKKCIEHGGKRYAERFLCILFRGTSSTTTLFGEGYFGDCRGSKKESLQIGVVCDLATIFVRTVHSMSTW